MKLTIKSLKGVAYPVEIDVAATVEDLKKEIQKLHGFDSELTKLLFNGVILQDSKTFIECNLKENIPLTMMQTKIKPKNVEEKKVEEKLEKDNKDTVSKISVKEYPDQIKHLKEMGYSETEARVAINASNGNVSQAIDILTNGPGLPNIPQFSEFLDAEEEEEEGLIELNSDAINNIDISQPNAIKNISSVVKVLLSEDPDQLENILEDMEDFNPRIIEFIKQNESEFRNLITQPITQDDLTRFNQLLGGDAEECEHHDGDEMDENVGGEGDHFNNENVQNQQNLSPTDMEAIERLKALGFTEVEVIQAYIVCDKNEELTANFLIENKYKEEDMYIDCNNYFNYIR
jgi:UV excision repair protein RAD23